MRELFKQLRSLHIP